MGAAFLNQAERVLCHDPILSLEDVSFSYEGMKVIDHLNFIAQERDFVGLAGSNGAGKSTLLKMIVGLLKPESGRIRLFGTPLDDFRDWQRVGYVPQKSNFNPLFPATVSEVVTSGLYNRNTMFKRNGASESRKCTAALEALDITSLADRKIGQLSGGQQQRVFLARALVGSPELLILDEPTVGVDVETQESFFHLLTHLHQHHHLTFLMVTHDREMLSSILGDDPASTSGKLKFFVKHTHAPEDCDVKDLSHGGGNR
ncbi:metal ABC transporter ATP-binding protein [Gorillibacterium timonense]|uniref:metal ABC transporter ATP-binding protein n=1 Tax=Gorillibacterium timonense TaxID=1689269 RepID=UPI00071CA8EF|nr:metal ABC transporter ATP-binding protein [Gorillibacterium timonense]